MRRRVKVTLTYTGTLELDSDLPQLLREAIDIAKRGPGGASWAGSAGCGRWDCAALPEITVEEIKEPKRPRRRSKK